MEEELNQIPITTTQPPAAFPSLDSVISSSPASSASYSAHPMHPMPPKPLPFISDQDVVRNTAGTYAIFGSLYFLALAAVTAVSLSSQSLTRMEFTFLSHLWTTNYGLALPVAVQAGSITESGYLAIVLALCVIYSFMNLVEFGSRHNAAINKHATDKEIISWGAYAGSPAKGHVQHSLVFVGCIVQLLTLLSMQNSALREFYWCVFSMAVGCTAIYMVGYAYSCLHPHRGERTPSLTLVVTSWAMVLLGLMLGLVGIDVSSGASRMTFGIERLQRGTNALSHAESLRWKLAFNSAVCSIASGPNAVASLLDMTVFVTEARMSLEEYWQPKVFGDSALPMLENCRTAEVEIWKLADRVLKLDQTLVAILDRSRIVERNPRISA